MYQIILLIHVFIGACIIGLVLVQQGKGATMGAAFGAGASATVFGSRGSGSFLFRITAGFIAVFFLTSIGLNYIATQKFKQTKVYTIPTQPAAPANSPAVPAAPVDNTQAPAAGTQNQTQQNTVPAVHPAGN